MLHEVKILDAKGKVKKVLSRKSASKHFWKNVEDSKTRGIHINKNGKKTEKLKAQANSDDPLLEL